jgi:hypothetical protein
MKTSLRTVYTRIRVTARTGWWSKNRDRAFSTIYTSSGLPSIINENDGFKATLVRNFRQFEDNFLIIVGSVVEDNDYATIVKNSSIDLESWKDYLNKFKIKTVKSPLGSLTVPQVEILVDKLSKAEKNIKISSVISEEKNDLLACKDYLFNILHAKALEDLKEKISVNKVLAMGTNMSLPHEWYPYTRLGKRKIVYHGGPTNSGKVSFVIVSGEVFLFLLLPSSTDISSYAETKTGERRIRWWGLLWTFAVASIRSL